MPRKPHVSIEPRDGASRWAVQTDGSQRAYRVFDTQDRAIQVGRVVAQHKQTELVVKDQQGRIRQRDSFGGDPVRFPG